MSNARSLVLGIGLIGLLGLAQAGERAS